MEISLNGKIALVSGAGRGIGKAIAEKFAEACAKVICVSKNPSSCEKTAEEIRSKGLDAEAFACDVSKPDDIKKLCDEIIKKFGRVDILVNNAGITRDTLFAMMKDEQWNDVISTNLSSCFHMTQNLIRPMMGNRWGRIINMSSVVGSTGNAGQANYAAAKAGVLGLTKSLAREFAGRNITVNAIAPGFIETDMTAVLSDKIKDNLKSVIPMKRMGTAEDIANAALFLASDMSSYITGQTISVNGGMAM